MCALNITSVFLVPPVSLSLRLVPNSFSLRERFFLEFDELVFTIPVEK